MKKEIQTLLTAALLAFGVPHAATPQHELTIGLAEAFDMAVANSKQLKLSASATETAGSAVASAKAGRAPHIALSAQVSYIGDGLLADRDFGNATTIDMPHFGNCFGIEATQVVFAGGRVTRGIELASLEKSVAELSLRSNELDICFLVAAYYLDLYKLLNRSKVYEKHIEQTELLISEVRAKEKQGMALSSDVTRHELQRQSLQLSLIETRNDMEIINHQLVVTLGLPPDTRIIPDEKTLQTRTNIDTEANLRSAALADRPDLQTATLQTQIAHKQAQLAKAEMLPTVSIVAADHMDGPILIEVPTIDNNFNYWYVGLGVRYNLSSLYTDRRRLQTQKLRQQEAANAEALALERAELELHSAYTKFREAEEKISLYETGKALADENYRIVNNRYLNDLALITDILDAANATLNAELQLANAKIDIIFNYYKLQRAIGRNICNN